MYQRQSKHLQVAPVVGDDDPDVLGADDEGDDHPGDEEAVVAEVRPEDEHEAAADTEQGVEHRELDDGADTHVLALTLAEDGQHL